MRRQTKKVPPPERPGIIDLGDGFASFGLFAPGKKSVDLLADFNSWQPGADRMQPRENGLWLIQKNVGPGRFGYRFLIDGETEICDPYAQAVEPDATGKAPRAVFAAGRPPFCWRHDSRIRPRLQDLIIMEILVPDFSPEGTFGGIADRLDYLHDLRINAIELLPVQEAREQSYWGYQPTYFFAPRREYGAPDDLKWLVDEAHARNMAVMLDMVFAHTAWEHPFCLMYNQQESPWYGKPIGRPNQFRMPSFSFQKPAALQFLRDVQFHWLHEYHVDGLRYDYIASISGNEQGQGTPWLVKTAHEIKPDVLCIGEWLPEEPERIVKLGLNAVWHGATVSAFRALSDEKAVKNYDWRRFEEIINTLDYAHQGYKAANFMINYAESHDDHRIVRTAMRAGFDLDTAVRKSALIATALMTAAGEPMLYQGQEWGERAGRRKNEPNKLNWKILETDEGILLHRHVRRMCRLRRSSSALSAGTFALAAVDARKETVVWHRTYGAERAVVALNFSGTSRSIGIPFPATGFTPYPNRWEEFFSGEECTAAETGVERELLPYTAQIFFPFGVRPAIEG